MNNDRYYKAFSLPHDTFYGETTKNPILIHIYKSD